MTYNKEQLTKIFRRLASNGTAPEEGCELFGVGYDDAFKRLIREYVEDALPAGESAEKFVIGPYGSGKTHFLRHFMTLARERGCVTSEIQLNKKIDYTQTLVVYREVAAGLKVPDGKTAGVKALLEAAVEKVNSQFRQQCPDDAARLELTEGWISALDGRAYKFDRFGKIVQKALRAYTQKEGPLFEALTRWIQGEVDAKELIKDLPRDLYLSPVKKSEQELFAGNLMLSLCQFIRYAGFKGTIVGMDESEQGLDVSREKQQRIMSMLQANINAVADLQDGSVFILYAFTPDLESRFSTFPALQQRIDVPTGQDFFENGNTLAAKIELTRRNDPGSELIAIGSRLVDLFFKHFGDGVTTTRAQAAAHVEELAKQIVEQEYDSSNRRTMVKAACSYLWKLRKGDDPLKSEEEEAAEELRHLIATVGKKGQPGEFVRCVVSVSMLTEGWDANNVTHILGIRAFGSQLLCEQVVGRGLRRINYDPDKTTGLLPPEYVDVYGIPFSVIPFKGRPVDQPTPEDKPKHRVWAVPDRKAFEIRFPIVEGYVFALKQNIVKCDVDTIEPIQIHSSLEPTTTFLRPTAGYLDTNVVGAVPFDFIEQNRDTYYGQTHFQSILFQVAMRIVDELLSPMANSV